MEEIEEQIRPRNRDDPDRSDLESSETNEDCGYQGLLTSTLKSLKTRSESTRKITGVALVLCTDTLPTLFRPIFVTRCTSQMLRCVGAVFAVVLDRFFTFLTSICQVWGLFFSICSNRVEYFFSMHGMGVSLQGFFCETVLRMS